MAHQTTDTSVSIRKGMDVIEAVMCSTDRHDAPSLAERRETIPLFEICHEVRNTAARRWDMAADGIVMLGLGAPRARVHQEFMMLALDRKHPLRRIFVEFEMEPANEF